MNDDPSQVDVLYSSISVPSPASSSPSGNVIQAFVDGIMAHFIQCRLAVPQPGRDSVKLHVSVIRTRLQNNVRAPFDARSILSTLGDVTLGTCFLPAVQLCAMSLGEVGSDDHYTVVEAVSMIGQ